MKRAITKSNIDEIDCGETDTFIWDIALIGFGVKITPRNRRIFIYQYKDDRNKTKRLTIGRIGDLTVSQAKREAEKLRGRVIELGGNLNTGISSVEVDLKLKELSAQFLSEHVSDLKPRTQVEYARVFTSYLPERFLNLKSNEVTRSMVSDLRVRMKDNPHGFNRTVKVMRKFYNWLYDSGRSSTLYNPFQRMKQYKEKSSERYLSDDEIRLVLNEIACRKSLEKCPFFALSAIELLMFTGARKSEILTLKWSDVCLETNVLSLDDSKTGKKKIYLNDQSIHVLSSIPQLTNNPYVIIGRKHGKHLTDIRKTWKSILVSAGIPQTRVHDLRHTFASVALKNGLNLYTVGTLLGHRSARTTQRYVHFDNEFVKKENSKTGAAIIANREKSDV